MQVKKQHASRSDFALVSSATISGTDRTARSLRTFKIPMSETPRDETPRTPPPASGRHELSPDPSSSQRSPGVPKMEDSHFGLRFQDSAAASEKWLANNQHSDYVQRSMDALKSATNAEEIRQCLFCPGFAAGMGTARDIASTVKKALHKAADEERGHRVVSSDISFDLRRCLPVLFMEAVKSLSRGNGLHDEAVAWCFYANIAFLEHHGRRVGHQEGEHTEAPNIPVLVGGAPSSRKTCLIAMTTDFMLDASGAPQTMAKRECILADATVAGIRAAIYNYNRAAVIADEASNVYETPWSEKGSGGIHYLSKPKMNTYVLSEADDQATGKGQVHLGSTHHPYLFLHKVAGQTEIIEFIAQPVTHGFNKRFNLVFAPEHAPESSEVHTGTAKSFFAQLHAWMYKNAWTKEGHHYLDGYALTCYRSIKKAVEEFVQEKGIFLTKDAQRKVRFWSTDVLRLAHANMRICQFSVAQFGSSDMAAAEAVRTQPNVYEFILAVNMWLRQLHVHISFYKWFRQMTNSTSNASSRELTAAMERADDGDELSRLKLDLSVEDRLKHEILVHEKALVGAKLSSACGSATRIGSRRIASPQIRSKPPWLTCKRWAFWMLKWTLKLPPRRLSLVLRPSPKPSPKPKAPSQ